ncbi:cytochrome P450 [Actinomadura formosensis]|uniref:cytochrome P450 n=1 Tax=Actinomadura formosensis TaxID=60706 RepID=UPI000831A87C|nr:cytochrome P450 [Actinomadura formosensis]
MSQAQSWDARSFIDLTEYREVEEVLRRGRDFVVAGTKAESDEFVHGSLIAIDGREHLNRRRAVMKMIRASQPWGAEGKLIDAVYAHNLKRVQETAEPRDGMIHFDLIDFCKRVIWRVTAAFVGLDNVDDDETVARFQRLGSDVVSGLTVEYATPEARRRILDTAREARRQIREEMFAPSLARRRALILEAGDDPEKRDALPADLLTSLLLVPEDARLDEELIFREMVALLSASVNNPVWQVAWAIDDLLTWLADHPGDRARVGDREFINLAVKESLRLHRASRPYLVRMAVEDTVLESSGRFIPAGAWVSGWVEKANHDPSVFGDDAGVYNLNRTVEDPRVPHFGMAFGAGPHVCLGRPMLLWEQGSEEAQGIQTKMVRLLLERGVTKDPEGVQKLAGVEGSSRYIRYDVTMPVDRSGGN